MSARADAPSGTATCRARPAKMYGAASPVRSSAPPEMPWRTRLLHAEALQKAFGPQPVPARYRVEGRTGRM